MKKRSRGRTPARLRYIAEAAYPRGSETRARLIAAAIRVFGERGFEAASTREIAAAASLNTPALQYYFNNKEGLYVACAEHIVSQAWAVMKEAVVGAERLLNGVADDEELIEAFCAVQDKLADFSNGASGDWLLWLAREQTGHGAASGFLLKHRKSKRMTHVGRAMVARLMGRSMRDPESLIHELALNGHLLHFRLMRGNALRALGWKDIDAEGLVLIKRVARQHSVASLRAIIAARKQGSAGSEGRSRRRKVAASAGLGKPARAAARGSGS
ncbi:MAG: CerR family C-terminal domain-containing protein [Steroidobacteraceae bacterium]